jgi:hypothetical protein
MAHGTHAANFFVGGTFKSLFIRSFSVIVYCIRISSTGFPRPDAFAFSSAVVSCFRFGAIPAGAA